MLRYSHVVNFFFTFCITLAFCESSQLLNMLSNVELADLRHFRMASVSNTCIRNSLLSSPTYPQYERNWPDVSITICFVSSSQNKTNGSPLHFKRLLNRIGRCILPSLSIFLAKNTCSDN